MVIPLSFLNIYASMSLDFYIILAIFIYRTYLANSISYYSLYQPSFVCNSCIHYNSYINLQYLHLFTIELYYFFLILSQSLTLFQMKIIKQRQLTIRCRMFNIPVIFMIHSDELSYNKVFLYRRVILHFPTAGNKINGSF